jgi:hypothetical protein
MTQKCKEKSPILTQDDIKFSIHFYIIVKPPSRIHGKTYTTSGHFNYIFLVRM